MENGKYSIKIGNKMEDYSYFIKIENKNLYYHIQKLCTHSPFNTLIRRCLWVWGLQGEHLHPVACEHWLDGCRDKLLCHRLSCRSFCEGPISLDEGTCRTCWGRHLLWRGLRGRGKTHTASLVPSHIPLELRRPLKSREDADFGTTETLAVSHRDRASSRH